MKFALKTKYQKREERIDKRKIKRFKTQLKVFVHETDELLGYAEDLNIKALKLRSLAPIVDDGKVIQLWFRTSNDSENEKKLILSARKRWGTFSYTDPRIFNAGLNFIDLTEESLDSIQELISEYSK